ncbi:MAG: hypothetical protein WD874_00395, partial [Parcubacteria group bacterium]
VAISILVLSVSGSFTAVQSGIFSTNLSKEGIVAYYLAQEGIEEIRNIRDENGLKGNTNWLANIASQSTDPCYFGKSCNVDAVTNTLTACSGSIDTCPVVRKDTANGFYGYNAGWAPTQYRRAITMTSINSNEVSILVTVKWQKGTLTREFKVRENIFNWQ